MSHFVARGTRSPRRRRGQTPPGRASSVLAAALAGGLFLAPGGVPGAAGGAGVGFGASPLAAQSALDQIRSVGNQNAELYLAPGLRGLGLALTAGVFDRASVLPALHVDAGIRVSGSLRSDDDTRFEARIPTAIVWETPSGESRAFQQPYAAVGGSLDAPTVLGQGEGPTLEPFGAFRNALLEAGENPDDYRLRLPSGLDISIVPAAVFFASVGVGLATEVTVRYLPGVEVSPDLGGFSGAGFAVKHEVSQWLPSPVDLSVGIGSQSLLVDGFLEASTLEGWILAGKGLGPLSVFGTVGVRQGSVDVEYRARNDAGIPGIPDDEALIAFSTDLGTRATWGGGVRLQLLLLNLAAQYTAGDASAFSIKVALGIP